MSEHEQMEILLVEVMNLRRERERVLAILRTITERTELDEHYMHPERVNGQRWLANAILNDAMHLPLEPMEAP